MATLETLPATGDAALRANLQQYGRAFLREVAESAVKYRVILRSPTLEELQTGKLRPGSMVVDHNQSVRQIEMWLCRTFLTTPCELDLRTLLAEASS